MVKYIAKRVLTLVIVFLALSAVVFILINMAPGNPVDYVLSRLEGGVTEEQYQSLLKAYDLDKPAIYRYGKWLVGVLHGDLGTSTLTKQPVADMIGVRLGPSLSLMGAGMLIAIVISIPLGITAAWRPYKFWDNVSTFVAFMGTALPSFFLGLCMLYLFAVKLRWLPAYGMYPANTTPTFLNTLPHLIMPAFLVGFGCVGDILKQTRGALLEVLNEEYIKTARSKGLSERVVLIGHGLRNALIPVVTVIGLLVPYVVGGSVVIERIFGWPGIGSLLILAFDGRDYNVIMGIAVMVCIVVMISNIALDLLYGLIDPRVRREI